jgi:hypothetical protein
MASADHKTAAGWRALSCGQQTLSLVSALEKLLKAPKKSRWFTRREALHLNILFLLPDTKRARNVLESSTTREEEVVKVVKLSGCTFFFCLIVRTQGLRFQRLEVRPAVDDEENLSSCQPNRVEIHATWQPKPIAFEFSARSRVHRREKLHFA